MVGKGGVRAENLLPSQVRRAPLSEGPHSLGCYNPVMEDSISYATLRFPVAEADTPRIGYGRPQEGDSCTLGGLWEEKPMSHLSSPC